MEPHSPKDDVENSGARPGKAPLRFIWVMGVMVTDWCSGFPKVRDGSRERELRSRGQSQGSL